MDKDIANDITIIYDNHKFILNTNNPDKYKKSI